MTSLSGGVIYSTIDLTSTIKEEGMGVRQKVTKSDGGWGIFDMISYDTIYEQIIII